MIGTLNCFRVSSYSIRVKLSFSNSPFLIDSNNGANTDFTTVLIGAYFQKVTYTVFMPIVDHIGFCGYTIAIQIINHNIIMNFRVSPEEKQMIEERVKLSGMAKGEYFIQSCMHQKINVLGNIRTFDAIKESVSKLDRKLMELQSVEELDEVTLESLRMVLELLDGIYNKTEEEN